MIFEIAFEKSFIFGETQASSCSKTAQVRSTHRHGTPTRANGTRCGQKWRRKKGGEGERLGKLILKKSPLKITPSLNGERGYVKQ